MEYVNPWVVARNLFRPTSADARERFQILSDWRARIGAGLIVLLSIPYAAVPDIAWGFIDNAGLSMLIGAMIAASAGAVVFLVSQRGATVGGLMISLRRPLATLVITFAMGVVVRSPLIGVLAVPIVGWVLSGWTVVFLSSMMWYSLRWVFGVNEIHGMLGPVVSALTAIAAFTADRIIGGATLLPYQISSVIKISGLATVCVLAVAEFICIVGIRPPVRSVDPGSHTNKLAVASILAVWVFWPAGVCLAVMALRQIRVTGERGSGLAVSALVVPPLLIVALCVAVVVRT